jgi:hypothetical protein
VKRDLLHNTDGNGEIRSGAILVENSDGHSFFEIGENDKIEELLKRLRVDGDEIFINRDDLRLDEFLSQRKRMRE